MRVKKIARILLVVLCLTVIGLFLINSKTPFFTPKAGDWSIGYAVYDNYPENINLQKGNIISLEKMKMINPKASLIADPFFITEQDTTYLFFEYKTDKEEADIGLMKSIDGVHFKYDTIVLDEAFHLSYPHVFKHKDEYFMLPETKRANNVLLYKSHNFPYDWKIHDTLISHTKLKDPSIFLSDSLNFLIASDDHFSLYIYESDSLFGKWKKKKKNNLLRLGTEARPAGRIYVNAEHKIILPLQNCSRGYGYGLSLYELGLDNKKNYNLKLKEKYVLKANPEIHEFSGGMHHLDIQKIKNGFFVVYDGYSAKPNQKVFNWKFPLKATYLDTKNYIYDLLK